MPAKKRLPRSSRQRLWDELEALRWRYLEIAGPDPHLRAIVVILDAVLQAELRGLSLTGVRKEGERFLGRKTLGPAHTIKARDRGKFLDLTTRHVAKLRAGNISDDDIGEIVSVKIASFFDVSAPLAVTASAAAVALKAHPKD